MNKRLKRELKSCRERLLREAYSAKRLLVPRAVEARQPLFRRVSLGLSAYFETDLTRRAALPSAQTIGCRPQSRHYFFANPDRLHAVCFATLSRRV